jgi:hypothetical protein
MRSEPGHIKIIKTCSFLMMQKPTHNRIWKFTLMMLNAATEQLWGNSTLKPCFIFVPGASAKEQQGS